MLNSGPQVNDEGTGIVVVIKEVDPVTKKLVIVDISTATSKTYTFRKPQPDGSLIDKIPDFKTNGTDGTLVYLTEEGFLNVPGTWYVQSFVIMPGGKWHDSIESFSVGKNLR